MRRILLIIEDFNELAFIETLLKKLGFDVESLRNDVSVATKLMSFTPNLVIATGDGKKVNGANIVKKVKKKGQRAKLLLLYPRGKQQKELLFFDGVYADGLLDSPIAPKAFILTLAKMLDLDFDLIFRKFEKLALAHGFSIEEDTVRVTARKGAEENLLKQSQIVDGSMRVKNYQKFLLDLPDTGQNMFPKQAIQNEIVELRKKSNDPEIQKIDEARQAFVKALFKKDH